MLLYGHTGAHMKNYYTVELQGEPLSRQENIRLGSRRNMYRNWSGSLAARRPRLHFVSPLRR